MKTAILILLAIAGLVFECLITLREIPTDQGNPLMLYFILIVLVVEFGGKK